MSIIFTGEFITEEVTSKKNSCKITFEKWNYLKFLFLTANLFLKVAQEALSSHSLCDFHVQQDLQNKQFHAGEGITKYQLCTDDFFSLL